MDVVRVRISWLWEVIEAKSLARGRSKDIRKVQVNNKSTQSYDSTNYRQHHQRDDILKTHREHPAIQGKDIWRAEETVINASLCQTLD